MWGVSVTSSLTILLLIPSFLIIHFFISATISDDKNALKGNILTTNKDIYNTETDFDPSQNDRLDINPGCFMKMPFICPSSMMILSELTENKKNEL